MENFDSYVGRRFDDKLTVINVIGAGEYSVVLGAYDAQAERTVALKLLRPEYNDDPVVSERFATEVHILSLLSHPNIVRLYEAHLDAPIRYFTMEYIEGITLKKHLQSRGALSTDETLFFARQILSALEEVHEKGIVHSDIKPQNVVVLGDGSVRLMDFGIASLVSEEPEEAAPIREEDPFCGVFSDEPETEEIAVGTVHYVSPEQAEGKSLDQLSDIYSFGVMLYEMATGILPFFGENPQKIATMHVRLQPIPPSHVAPFVPEGMDRIILRAMEKLPFARFPSAAAMREALDRFDEERNAPAPTEEETEPVPFLVRCRDLLVEYWRELNLPSLVTGALCALLVTVVIGLGILSEALVTERNNPDHIRIPSLKGHDLATVADTLDPDFYEIEVTYVSNDDRQGRILKQSPAAGRVFKTRDGETIKIRLTVACRSLPPTMPDLRRMTLEEVTALLASYDCEVVIIEVPDAYIPAGEILSTIPAAGAQTARTLTLYVSAGYKIDE